jgi:hypothetical protein
MFLKIIMAFTLLIPCALGCEVFIQQQEINLGIPTNLLRSVALVESGRIHNNGQHTSWPWTINVNGQGYVFDTKQQAIEAVKKFQKKGIKSIDVGCMQINLKHHPHAFRNLSDGFDPQLNVAYAAQYMRELKEQHESWYAAVAHYHSATPRFHTPYRAKVVRMWEKIRKKQGIQVPVLTDVAFISKNKLPSAPITQTAEPTVRFTTYEHVGHTQKIRPMEPIMAPPGNFIPLNASHPVVNARVRVKTHTYAIDDAMQTLNGKVFFPLKS